MEHLVASDYIVSVQVLVSFWFSDTLLSREAVLISLLIQHSVIALSLPGLHQYERLLLVGSAIPLLNPSQYEGNGYILQLNPVPPLLRYLRQ